MVNKKLHASFSSFTVHLKAVYRRLALGVQNASPHLPEFCYLLISCHQKVSSIGLNGVWVERPTELSSLLNALSKVFPLQLRSCLLLCNAGEAVLISPSGFMLEPLLRSLLGSFW